MGTLHIISKSPFAHNALADCLRVCGNATILLTEDAVSAALANSEWARQLKRAGLRVHLLQADIDARGLMDRIDIGFTRIDYDGFVQLCCAHNHNISWY